VENTPRVIVYWYTKWCPDCFATKPHIPRLESEYQDIPFYSMDRDSDIQLAKHLEIYGVPSLILFENGDELSRLVHKKRKTYIEIKAFIEEAMHK